MATKLDAALERIDVAVDRIRTKVSKPTESIEDVATAVEALGTGGSEPQDIYKVKSIAERDAIEAEEGDTCLVLESSIKNASANDEITSMTFPATVILPEAFTDYANTSFGNNEAYTDVMIMLEPTMCRIDIMTETDYSSVKYESTDGITYTRTTAEESIELGVTVTCSYPEEWNDNVGYFLQIGSVNFEGIFQYVDGAWEFANVGLSADSSMMFKPSGGYTSKGTVLGNLDRKQFRKSNIYIQDTEPEDKKGIWVVSKEKVYNGYTNEKATGTTEVDLNNPIIFTKGTSYNKYFGSYGTLTQHAYCFTKCRTHIYQFSTSESTSSCDVCIIGTNAYCFNFWNSSSDKRFAVKVNLETGAKTTLTKYSSSTIVNGMDNLSSLSSDGTNIYCLAHKTSNNGGNVSLCVYSISGNSWTTISTPFVNKDTLYYQYYRNEAAMCIGPGLILLTGKMYEANTTSATRVLFWLYDYNKKAVVADFYIDRADLNSNDTSALLDLFSGVYSFYVEDGILKFPHSDFEVSTSNFTKESVIAAENARTKHLKSGGYIFNHNFSLNPDCTIGTYQGNIGMTAYKDGKMYKMYPKYPEGFSSLTCVISYIKDNTLYSTFLCDNSTHNIFTADVSNPEEYTHVDSSLWASIQVGSDGIPCEVAEGLSLNVKNFHIHNYVGSSTNAAYKVYVGDGTSWKLISENS